MVHVNQVIDITLTAIDNKDLGLAQSWFQKNKHETLESFEVILKNGKSSYFSNPEVNPFNQELNLYYYYISLAGNKSMYKHFLKKRSMFRSY